MPIEPLGDVLLPLFGLSVGIFGVQLTLGLSIAEPLLLLLLTWFQQVARNAELPLNNPSKRALRRPSSSFRGCVSPPPSGIAPILVAGSM